MWVRCQISEYAYSDEAGRPNMPPPPNIQASAIQQNTMASPMKNTVTGCLSIAITISI